MKLLPGVSARTIETDRLGMHYLECGPRDGVPVVLVHGNLSTSRFFEHLMPGAPGNLRLIAPDMRGFGRTDRAPIDATRGLADWAEDIAALLTALNLTRPVHLAGWSAAGLAVAQYAMTHRCASITLIDPVSPFGFGGTLPDGRPCWPDAAGSGGAGVNPELVQRLRDGDTSAESPFSIRNVMNSLYWNPDFKLPPEREDLLVDEVLLTSIGEDTYPGDGTPSENWPGFAPGVKGILNALSPKYCDWSGIIGLDPKPPILWTRGTLDGIVSDTSALEMGTLGAAGQIPGWPGEQVYPPQPMVTQTATVLDAYAAAGGTVRTEVFSGSGHGPMFDAQEAWSRAFFEFIAASEVR